MVEIRKATQEDRESVWKIIKPILAAGDSYVFEPRSSKRKMLSYWFASSKHTYVAILEGKVVGTFILKDNQPDLGSHIANGSYMTDANYAGRGIGKAMGIFSLEEARRLGYQAVQFNIVVKTNERAVKLWQSIGFQIIGEIPEAFRHPTLGLTNAFIMYQKL